MELNKLLKKGLISLLAAIVVFGATPSAVLFAAESSVGSTRLMDYDDEDYDDDDEDYDDEDYDDEDYDDEDYDDDDEDNDEEYDDVDPIDEDDDVEISISSTALEDGEIDLKIGKAANVTADFTVNGNSASLSDFANGAKWDWYVADKDTDETEDGVISVDDNGAKATIEAIGQGEVILYARLVTDDEYEEVIASAAITVFVYGIPAQKIVLSGTSSIAKGKTTTIKAQISPTNHTDEVKWTTENKGIIKIKSKSATQAVILGQKVGTEKVTCTAGSKTKTYSITVKNIPTTGISIQQSSLKIAKGSKGKLTAVVTPGNATDAVKWTVVSGEKYVSLKASGTSCTVTGKKAGTALVKVTSGSKTAQIKVTVKKPYVKLSQSSVKIRKGRTFTIKISEKFPLTDSVEGYVSNKPKYVSVSKDGVVKGLKKGTATITVNMKSGASANFKVTVQ